MTRTGQPASSESIAMLTLHHLNNARSQRILWLLEALGVPYDIKRYQRDSKTMLAPPELKAVHPLGKSPVLTDGDLTLAESGLIIEYLIDRYADGRFAPQIGTPARLDFAYWLHYAEGSLMPLILLKLVFRRVAHTPAPFFMRPALRKVSSSAQEGFVDPQLALHLGYLDAHLAKTDWFVGDTLTGADMQMSFPIEAAEARVGLAKYPALVAFLSRIRADPAYQRALEKGGPFALS
jgi:glutathione S-transferase